MLNPILSWTKTTNTSSIRYPGMISSKKAGYVGRSVSMTESGTCTCTRLGDTPRFATNRWHSDLTAVCDFGIFSYDKLKQENGESFISIVFPYLHKSHNWYWYILSYVYISLNSCLEGRENRNFFLHIGRICVVNENVSFI